MDENRAPTSSFRDARRPRDVAADTLAPARGTNTHIVSRSMTSAGSLEVRDDVVARSHAESGMSRTRCSRFETLRRRICARARMI